MYLWTGLAISEIAGLL